MDSLNAGDSSVDLIVVKPQRAYAAAFGMMALALAGCVSGFGVKAPEAIDSAMPQIADGDVIAVRSAVPVGFASLAAASIAIPTLAAYSPSVAYTVKLKSGELVTISQPDADITVGAPVLVEYGATDRVIPERLG